MMRAGRRSPTSYAVGYGKPPLTHASGRVDPGIPAGGLEERRGVDRPDRADFWLKTV